MVCCLYMAHDIVVAKLILVAKWGGFVYTRNVKSKIKPHVYQPLHLFVQQNTSLHYIEKDLYTSSEGTMSSNDINVFTNFFIPAM